MASLTHVLERMQKKEKPLWHLHRSSEIESVDELQFASGRRMKTSSISQTKITEKRQNDRPAYAPSTAVSPIAIHHGNHGTYEPAGTTIIEQHSRQQTTKQVVVRKFQIRKTETTEVMTRMKRIQRSKPTVISHHDSIQWNGITKTAIFEGHGRKSNLQHGDLMLQQELRHNGKIWSENIILIHIHSNLSPGFIPTTWRWGDIAQIVMPAHELQLTYGRRVNPIQHFPFTKVPRSPAKEPIAERRDHNERFQRNQQCNQFQL